VARKSFVGAAKSFVGAVVGLGVVSVALAAVVAGAPDRLERFRTVAAARLGPLQMGDDTVAGEAYREIYTLLDEEIVDNLSSGGPFASVEFLQERLDAFTGAWGATAASVSRIGRLTAVAFQLTDASVGNSVRIYGRLPRMEGDGRAPGGGGGGPPRSAAAPGGEDADAALLTTLTHDGRPALYPLPPAVGGAAQFLVAWEGAASGRGTRALRIDHIRQQGTDVRVMWSTADTFGDGLLARRYSMRGAEIRIRYEVRYPGWTPGCEGQTEEEEIYRLAPGAAKFARVARHDVNAWHRDFRVSVARFFSALSAGDRAALSGLVPDPTVRGRLPRTLAAEPACDAADGANPERVSVAASGAEGPWELTWQRTGSRWRLVHANPVIQ
jgi:hypothetical protein